ncbi:Tim10/DDP family zinc finger-domain-containing protein [Lactarius indigo]|nr:Tim10/DDP family zinc finger-domain-containing protein [Lactarius indigo]
MSSIFGGSGSSSTDAGPPKDLNARKEAGHGFCAATSLPSRMRKNSSTKRTTKCFAKCVTKPSTSLSSSEETCLSRCFDRYMEAFNIISRTYTARLTKERLEGQV